ncbi:MAG: carboxypeptidase-like regulatory domain-containing protein, partial [Terriglobales bacterium]
MLWSLVLFLLAVSAAAFAQTNPTGTLAGVVTDPSAAAIPGASVTVTEIATGRAYNAQSDATGRFVVADLSPGSYDVLVNHTGFQAGAYRAVQIVVGQTYSLQARLKVGQVGTTVEVQAGQEVVQTQQTSIGDQVTGQQILQVPITSRNTTELAIMEPGAQTMSSPRNSQFNGLPPGALNITYDGINSQDNLLKSTTGSSFFSTEQPRVDDVQEFNITTAAADASESGEGAVQISIVSAKGTNQWHGGGWEYLRNDAFNANNYFSNLNGQPRQRLRLNEFGGKVGGAIIKNKLFFFADLDYYLNPQGTLRQRTVLTTAAQGGLFTYSPNSAQGASPGTGVTCTAGANQTCTANLFTIAGTAGVNNNTLDTLMQTILSEEGKAVTAPGVTLGASNNPNNQLLLFNSNSSSKQIYPDVRLDYTINAANSLEFDYHYSYYNAQPDLLNNADATFPVAPFNANRGAQLSDRSLLAVAWRSQLSSTMTNELRVGGNSAPVWFGQGETPGIYPTITSNLGSIALRPTLPSNSLFNSPFLSFNPNSRNTALAQLTDTLSWLHGNHSMSFGTNLTGVRFKQARSGQVVATAGLGLNSNDPASAAFTPGTLPGVGSNDLSLAQTLYGELAGRVTSFSQTVNVNPNTRAYAPGFNNLEQVSQREAGVFFTDSWHMMSNLTFNYGLRWEWEGTPTDDLNEFSVANGALGIPGLYGVSGVGNLFMPGTLTGTPTTFSNDRGQSFYPSYKKDFAPSVGLSWTPNVEQGWLHSLFGSNGQTVLRAGYSIAYDREGLNFFTSQVPANPGFTNNGFLT